MKLHKQSTSKRKKIIVISLFLVIAALVSYGIAAYANTLWPFQDRITKTADDSSGLNAATDEQTKTGYDIKEDKEPDATDDKKQPQPSVSSTPTPSGKQNVSVTITNYSVQNGSLQINAIASTLNSGTCVAEIIKSGTVIASKTGSTFPQSSFVSCTDLTIPFTEAMRGSVVLSVTYDNATQDGETKVDASL